MPTVTGSMPGRSRQSDRNVPLGRHSVALKSPHASAIAATVSTAPAAATVMASQCTENFSRASHHARATRRTWSSGNSPGPADARTYVR